MTYKHLLVPLGGDHLADGTMEASIALARQLGASITAFVAEPLPPPRSQHASQRTSELRRARHEFETTAHAEGVLDRFRAKAEAANVPFTAHFAQVPRIADAIIEAAESRGCDMIVMMTHGRGAFGEFLFGSDTKAVLAGSKLPLLVLH